jgi:hypothetical protein
MEEKENGKKRKRHFEQRLKDRDNRCRGLQDP